MVHLYRKRGRPYVGTSHGRHLPRRGREQRGATGPPADSLKRTRHAQYITPTHTGTSSRRDVPMGTSRLHRRKCTNISVMREKGGLHHTNMPPQ
eukprot:4892912-Pyramimonas_sp.AAC.1